MRPSDLMKDLHQIPFNPPITSSLNNNIFAARLFLLKRIAFKYEDEIRVILVKKNSTSQKGILFNYTCNNLDLIHSIIIAPDVGDYMFRNLYTIFKEQYGFYPYINGTTNVERVRRSTLYKVPKAAVLHLE